ncbi:MAG: MBL fold metallo-hydrolase [Desulfuromonadaceae bacterium]|nr:MBL fold metallo-hydrolase [Desulfuromonadaceae bacterium]
MDLNCLHCVDLDQPSLQGFRSFISSWIYRDGQLSFVVDPGPLSSLSILLEALRQHGVQRLDYVLLTHIHIDHAGATGELLRHFPEARVLCHPDGIAHMVDPSKLWQGSLKVLGAMATAYGEIMPVPAVRIGYDDWLDDLPLTVLQTPGHAVHHLSFVFDDLLIAGEVAGVRSEARSGIYMRPATPPRFELDVALNSLGKVMVYQPQQMIFAHYGLVKNAMDHLTIARRQLLLWVQGVIAHQDIEPEQHDEAICHWLLEQDVCFRRLGELPEDIQARERYFLGNTLRGMGDYVQRLTPEQRNAVASRPLPPWPDSVLVAE